MMEGLVRHNCGDHVKVTSDYLDIFYDLSDDTWYMKIEEPEFDLFESYGVSINYCPLCGVELTQNEEEILIAKQRYYEAKLREINHHLRLMRTISVATTICREVPLDECEHFKDGDTKIISAFSEKYSSEDEGEN